MNMLRSRLSLHAFLERKLLASKTYFVVLDSRANVSHAPLLKIDREDYKSYYATYCGPVNPPPCMFCMSVTACMKCESIRKNERLQIGEKGNPSNIGDGHLAMRTGIEWPSDIPLPINLKGIQLQTKIEVRLSTRTYWLPMCKTCHIKGTFGSFCQLVLVWRPTYHNLVQKALARKQVLTPCKWGLIINQEFYTNTQPFSVIHSAVHLAVENFVRQHPKVQLSLIPPATKMSRPQLEGISLSHNRAILLTDCDHADQISRHINGSWTPTTRQEIRLIRFDTLFCMNPVLMPHFTRHVPLYSFEAAQVASVLATSLTLFAEADLPSVKSGIHFESNYFQHFNDQDKHPLVYYWTSSSKTSVGQYLKGRTLTITTLNRPPFVYTPQETNRTSFAGICFEVIHALQQKYSFNYVASTPPNHDKSYGVQLPNGSWNGMIRVVKDLEVDIGGAPFTIQHPRQTAVDFSTPFHEEPTAILTPPPQQDSKTFACVKPYRAEVWLLIILMLGIFSSLLWLYHRILWSLNKRNRCPTMSQEFFFTFGVITTQSGQDVAPGLGPRVLAAVWCLSSVIIVYVYMGSLMSFLTIIKYRPIIDSLEELATTRKLKWAVLKGSALDGLFTEAKDGVYSVIGTGIQQKPSTYYVMHDADGVQKVLTGQFAFIKEKSRLISSIDEDYSTTRSCSFSIAKQEFFKASFGIIWPKNSYLNLLNQEMVEAGLPGHWLKKLNKPNPCTDQTFPSNGNEVKSLKLDDLQSAFVVLGTGFAAAFTAYVLEWIYFQCCSKPFSSRRVS